MEQKFIAIMEKATKMIGVNALKITPPSSGLGWSVKVATEEHKNMLAIALERSGMATKSVSRNGNHYVLEA